MRRSANALLLLAVAAFGACAYYDEELLAPLPGQQVTQGSGGSAGSGAAAGAAGGGGDPAMFGGASGGGGAGASGGAGAGGNAVMAGAAGSSPGGGSAGSPLAPCNSKRPPGPPSSAGGASGSAGGADREFVVALRDFDFGEKNDTFGFDLDGACTTCKCTGDTASRCLLPAGGDPVASADGPSGEDHAVRAMFQTFGKVDDRISSEGVQKSVKQGEFTILVRVYGYNGLPDDPNVRVAWYVADKRDKAPLWDGTDQWPVRDYGVMGGDVNKPIFVDENGYVANHVLVGGPKGADKTSREVPFQVSSDFKVTLTGVYLTGTIVSVGATYGLEQGTLAGKWSTDDVLRQLGGVKLGIPLCPGTEYFGTLRKSICQMSDSGLFDGGSPTDLCRAISVGISFRAVPALIGTVATQSPPSSACPAYDPVKHGCGANP